MKIKSKTKELSPTEQNDVALSRATLEKAMAEILTAPPQETVALVERPRDTATGRYTPKVKLSKAAKSQKLMQKVLALKDATGKTLEERVATHLLNTSLTVDQVGLMAGAKTLETILARAVGKVPESAESLAAMQRDAVRIVFIQTPELMNNAVTRYEDQVKKPLRPSWDNPPYIDGEIVNENPAPPKS
jgi:hypothetical protein